MLKRNLIANYLGQGWNALMSFAFVPLYVNYLGIEAYGLIGFYALMQSWLNLFDLGMTPTLSREMARFKGGALNVRSIRDLLRSMEWIATILALVAGGSVVLASPWLANHWFQARHLPVSQVAQACMVMGLVLALRFIESIYRSSVIGLQRQVLYNGIVVLIATLRGLGALAVLAWVSPTIQAYFLWQVFVALLSLACMAFCTYCCLPSSDRHAKFSTSALRQIWRFAGGMTGISILAFLLTQVDKFILSRLLPLSEFGYYSLAATIASVISVGIAPITLAWYPKMCELFADSNDSALARTFHQGSQLVSVLAASIAAQFLFFAEPILRLWSRDPALAHAVAPLLTLLVLGNLLNGLNWMPYQAQLAHGWTRLAIVMNSVAVVLVVPAVLWITPHFGALGAASVWVSLNVGYLLLGIHLMFRRILVHEKWLWYREDLFFPVMASFLVPLCLKVVWEDETNGVLAMVCLGLSTIGSFTGALLVSSRLRGHLLNPRSVLAFDINN